MSKNHIAPVPVMKRLRFSLSLGLVSAGSEPPLSHLPAPATNTEPPRPPHQRILHRRNPLQWPGHRSIARPRGGDPQHRGDPGDLLWLQVPAQRLPRPRGRVAARLAVAGARLVGGSVWVSL